MNWFFWNVWTPFFYKYREIINDAGETVTVTGIPFYSSDWPKLLTGFHYRRVG